MICLPGTYVSIRDHVESDFEFYLSWYRNKEVMRFFDWKNPSEAEVKEKFLKIIEESKERERKRFFLL